MNKDKIQAPLSHNKKYFYSLLQTFILPSKFPVIFCLILLCKINFISAQPPHPLGFPPPAGYANGRHFQRHKGPILDRLLDSVHYYLTHNQLQKAIDFSNKMLKQAYAADKPGPLSLAYYRLGVVYESENMFYLAADNFLKSLDIAFKNDLELNIVETSLHLVQINKQVKDKQNNNRILNYLKAYLNKIQDPKIRLEALGIIGETYLSSALINKELKDTVGYSHCLDSAGYYFSYILQKHPHANFIGIMDLKFERGQYRKLIPELRKKVRNLGTRKTGVNDHLLQELAYCYLYTGRPDSALYFARQLIYPKNQATSDRDVQNALVLSKVYRRIGKLDSSYYFLNQAFNSEENLRMQRAENLTKELNIKYQTQKRENDLENSERFIAKQKEIIILLIFSSVVVLFIAVLIFLIYLQKKKAHTLLTLKNKKIIEQSKELEELTKYKEGLTAMIVHDLKNPLSAIIGLSNDLPVEDSYEYINMAGKKMLDMVHNILDIQKFEEAKFELICENVKIEQVLQPTIQEMAPLAEEQHVTIQYSTEQDYSVHIDKDVIHRVLGNILSNAVKYSHQKGKVVVNVGKEDDAFARVVVRDYGRGIPEEQLPHVFKKFWQHKGRKAGVARSVGLGLSFCKMAIEAHGGEITISSRPDEGTEVGFTVPLEVSVPQAPVIE